MARPNPTYLCDQTIDRDLGFTSVGVDLEVSGAGVVSPSGIACSSLCFYTSTTNSSGSASFSWSKDTYSADNTRPGENKFLILGSCCNTPTVEFGALGTSENPSGAWSDVVTGILGNALSTDDPFFSPCDPTQDGDIEDFGNAAVACDSRFPNGQYSGSWRLYAINITAGTITSGPYAGKMGWSVGAAMATANAVSSPVPPPGAASALYPYSAGIHTFAGVGASTPFMTLEELIGTHVLTGTIGTGIDFTLTISIG